MAEVISGEKLHKHIIDKYSFKVLAIGGKNQTPSHTPHPSQETKQPLEEPIQNQVNQTQNTQKSSKDSLIESLLKKTDEMSSNFIKLQMKLEAMQEEHKQEIQQIKQTSFEEGKLQGREEAIKECEEKYQENLNLFSQSISKLETISKEYNNALEKVKEELTSAAIEIAQEVVSVELEKNSTKIALALANSLIEELKEASTITLKVSPQDYSSLAQELQNLKNVKIVADNAVLAGGVIAISDIENIDAQIPKRFEQVKKVILSE